MERKLAAILAADIVGYSKMMGADEAATLAVIGELRLRTFEPSVVSHLGEVVKRMGDGWLVEFTSVLDAVNCAVAVQEQLLDHKTVKLRIGIHIGDVIHDDEGEIYGDGVNIASRLEGVAQVGGVAISDTAYSLLSGTGSPVFGGGDALDLKNISRPIRVWHWPKTTTNHSAATAPATDVMPIILLETFSLGGEVDAAADLALELQSGLQNALSNRSGIRVATSADDNVAPTYQLQGRCRVSGEKCRLHLSITAKANGETCWTTKIDGKIDDILGFVDEVVWKVGAAIRVFLNAHAGAEYASQPNSSLTEQQLLSKAAFFMHKFDEKYMALARETTAAAIAKAPENPMALAMHSYALFHAVPLAIECVENIDVSTIMSVADKAVYYGPKVDYAFHNRARIRLWLRRDHGGCVQDAKRALLINPDFHFAKEDLALADIFRSNAPSGVERLEDIISQLPTHPTNPYRLSILAIGYALLGEFNAALAHALDAYEQRPTVRLHAIAYAAAASGSANITGSTGFRGMLKQHGLTVCDAKRFPFSKNEETARLETLLEQSGLPK